MKVVEESLRVPVEDVVLEADVVIPDRPRGVVLFAHGSGSSRHSPRNRHVAAELRDAGLATVLADLLTPAEEQRDAWTGELRFAIGLLATRRRGAGRLADDVLAHRRTRHRLLRRQHRRGGRARRRRRAARRRRRRSSPAAAGPTSPASTCAAFTSPRC